MGGKGGVVSSAMLHMKDQRQIQYMGFHLGILHIRTQQAQQVFSRGQLLIRTVDVHAPIPLIMVKGMIAVCGQHGHDADQHHTLPQDIGNGDIPRLVIIGCQSKDTLAQGNHHILGRRFHNHVPDKIGGQGAAVCQAVPELRQFHVIGELPEKQQISNLLKTKPVVSHYSAYEIINIIAAVE